MIDLGYRFKLATGSHSEQQSVVLSPPLEVCLMRSSYRNPQASAGVDLASNQLDQLIWRRITMFCFACKAEQWYVFIYVFRLMSLCRIA